MHASRIGASRAKSATCSTSSRNVGSAHCRSSIENTSGRSAASCSSSVRIAQNVSSGALSLPAIPIACPTSSATLPRAVARPRERRELGAGRLGRVGLVQTRDLDERLGQGIERDALAVGEAPAAEDGRAIAELVEERRHEPRLADAPDAEDREELARPDRSRSGRTRSAGARAPAPARPSARRDAARTRRHRASTCDQAVRGHRSRSCPSGRAARRARRRPRRARARYVSSPSRISPECAACSRRAATFTASPVDHRRRRAPATTSPVFTPIRQASVIPWSRSSSGSTPSSAVAHVAGGAHRAQRVVLMDLRHAEDGHDRVTDELLDGAPWRRSVYASHRSTAA